jgi:hypothetical protein
VAKSLPADLIDSILPDVDSIIAGLPADLVESDDELRARVRLTLLIAHVAADTDDLEAAITVLRGRAAGDFSVNPFGPRVKADTFESITDIAELARTDERLDLTTVLALLYESGAIAARLGRRLILFLAFNAYVRRAIWKHGTDEILRRDLGTDRYVGLGRRVILASEISSLAVGEGYRATERELLARDAAARRAALDELLGAQSVDVRAAARIRRLAVRYGMDADATYRVAAIMPGPEADPTPEEPGMDEADLEQLADRIDRLLRRSARGHAASSGIRVPLAMTWRGAIVAILAADAREWQRLQEAVRSTLGRPRSEPSWTAVAVQAEGVTRLASALAELQEGLTVAEAIGRHGVIDDLSELAIERLLLSDPDLAGVVVERELGALLADQRMGEELIETVQTYFDAGGNRREIARRMHLADRTVTYRLQRVEELLGHGLDGEPGRRLSVALTLHRLTSDSRR